MMNHYCIIHAHLQALYRQFPDKKSRPEAAFMKNIG
jgi:hypothetical protein